MPVLRAVTRMRGGNRGQDRGRREPEPAARFNGEDLADRCPGRAPEVASAHQVRPGQVGGLLELGKQGVPAAHVLIKAPRAAGLQDRANSVSAAGASLTEHSSPQVTTASNFRPPREGPGSVAALPSQDSSNGDLGGCPMRGCRARCLACLCGSLCGSLTARSPERSSMVSAGMSPGQWTDRAPFRPPRWRTRFDLGAGGRRFESGHPDQLRAHVDLR